MTDPTKPSASVDKRREKREPHRSQANASLPTDAAPSKSNPASSKPAAPRKDLRWRRKTPTW
jgi:hypothetical protein